MMRRLTIGLAVLLALFVATYVVLGVTAPDTRTTPPAPADGETLYATGSLPDDLTGAVDAAVETLPLALGYDYRTLDAGLDRATALMTDQFGDEFRTTFEDSAAELARSKQAVTSATVRAAGVVRVDGERALCLIYVDQLLVSSTTVADRDNPVQVSQNRVLVGVTYDGGDWRVDSIQPF